MNKKLHYSNEEAFNILCAGEPILVDIKPAHEVCPELRKNRMLLHAGPPIEWERMCGPMKGAVQCAIVYEGWANTYDEAYKLAESGEIQLSPTHDFQFVGPVAGIVSPSMWVFCVKNLKNNCWAYCTMSEGMGRALRFGAMGEDVLKLLQWMEHVLGPSLSMALDKVDGINLKDIIRNALEMGDECHNRHHGARYLFIQHLFPGLIDSELERDTVKEVIQFISNNYYFFVNISMAACKAMTSAIEYIPGSSLVSVMARNGTDFGIRVSGLGNQWFTAPCERIHGILFEGFNEEDGNSDLGDSSITETAGIGAFAMASAPAISRYIGGTPREMIEHTLEMYQITYGEHPFFQIPFLNYRGTPTGIDIYKVVEMGIPPIINTSIAHKDPGVGQIGAGRTRAPIQCFQKAVKALEHAVQEKN